jgi:NitT/TauT family transport system substrate-binding protein
MLVDQKAYNDAAPFVTKLNVVTDSVAKDRAKEVEGVVRGIIEASRQFATDPKSWVEAMAAARPDVKRADLEDLAARYKDNWSVNGGINLEAIKFTTDTVYQDAEWQGLRKVAPSEWIDTSFADKALAALGVSNLTDPTGR